jgi:hypothetical protein
MKRPPEVVAEYLSFIFYSRFEYEKGSAYRVECYELEKIAGYSERIPYVDLQDLEKALNRKNLTLNFIDCFFVVERLAVNHGIRTIPRRLLLQVIADSEGGITDPNVFNPCKCRIANVNFNLTN